MRPHNKYYCVLSRLSTSPGFFRPLPKTGSGPNPTRPILLAPTEKGECQARRERKAFSPYTANNFRVERTFERWGMQRREGYWDQIGVDWGVIWVPRRKLWASKFFHITPQCSCTQQEIYYIRGLSFYGTNKIFVSGFHLPILTNKCMFTNGPVSKSRQKLIITASLFIALKIIIWFHLKICCCYCLHSWQSLTSFTVQ